MGIFRAVKRRWPLAFVAVAATAILVTIAGAAIPDGNGVIHTCFSQSTGTWRPIDAPTQKCKSGETGVDVYSVGGADKKFFSALAPLSGLEVTTAGPPVTIAIKAGCVTTVKLDANAVTNGKLVLDNIGSPDRMTKLNYIEIAAV